MRKQWGRWQIDTDCLTLSYASGGLVLVFALSPRSAMKPFEVLDWIGRSSDDLPLAEDDVRDLVRALGDLLGSLQGSPVLGHSGGAQRV